MEPTHESSTSSISAGKTRLESSSLAFNVVLHCTKTALSEHKLVTFKSPPLAILDVKEEIEKQYDVPVCTQDLSYEGHMLDDSIMLNDVRIRDGDTFHVKYLAKGQCAEIKNTILWLRLLYVALKDKTPSSSENMNAHLQDTVSHIIQEEMIEDLAFKHFFPWLEPEKYVNKLHFVYNGGVKVIMEVYAALLRRPWVECALRLKYIEYAILRVLWNLTETFPLRRLVTHNKGIQMCMQSMLRTRLEEGWRIEDLEPTSDPFEKSILVETVVAGLGTLCNLSELPECHVEIASHEDALHQMTCISLTPSVRILSPQLVATLFLCLAYTPQTHEQIANPTYIRRLLDACKIPRSSNSGDDLEEAIPMLRYFTLVFLAQVALVSPQHVPSALQQIVSDEMESFLETFNYKVIMDGEIKHWYVWSTFIPYVKLAYIPNTPQLEGPIGKLQQLSLQLVIFALQNMLGRENHREVLLKEDLLDYVTCMPQHVPSSLRPQAEELVQMVTSFPDIPEGPPKLLNTVKARLAKMHFGLEQVLSLSVSETVSQVFPVND